MSHVLQMQHENMDVHTMIDYASKRIV